MNKILNNIIINHLFQNDKHIFYFVYTLYLAKSITKNTKFNKFSKKKNKF